MTIEATLERIAVALEQIAASMAIPAERSIGEILKQVDRHMEPPTLTISDPTGDTPPPQTIVPVGTSMTGFSTPAASWPPYAFEARKLADDPRFQNWAIAISGRHYADIPDAVAFALQYICRVAGATAPADFQIPLVADGFIAMKRNFEATNAA